MSKSRAAPSLHHPAALIATWFGAGLLPWMPGTWGSLAALPFAGAICYFGGPAALAAAAVLAFVVGCWAAGKTARASGREDPGFIVIDEVAAQWLVLVAAPLDWRLYAAGFVLFRLFDITKPWPARLVERRVAGGAGIMLDDVVAALYALALLLIGDGLLGVRPL
ncbi:MAG TPA: phosphatidylglycerophosphatase A [Stellaceae bacterium]|jgi:phosphatidylglycerophosphatase A|nr:phosphatidylglycerophosphatase A [Stellaceae bacterium]